jgi:hypothetical protein
VAASVEELAFDLSLDSLYAQRNVLGDIRSRSTTFLTASSIVTSFVGGRAIDAVGLNAFTAAAIAAFLLTFLPAIYLASTSGEASLSIEGSRLYTSLPQTPRSTRSIERSLRRSTRCGRRTGRLSTAQ